MNQHSWAQGLGIWIFKSSLKCSNGQPVLWSIALNVLQLLRLMELTPWWQMGKEAWFCFKMSIRCWVEMMYRGVTGPELSSCLEIGKHYLAMHSSLLCSHTNCLRMHYRNQRSHFISASAACLCKIMGLNLATMSTTGSRRQPPRHMFTVRGYEAWLGVLITVITEHLPQ